MPAPTGVSPARGRQPAVWGRAREACGAPPAGPPTPAYPTYRPLYPCGRRADVASARISYQTSELSPDILAQSHAAP